MVSTRKAAAYSKRPVTAYTRTSKKRSKSYIKTIPPQKIVKFEMGNVRKHNEKKFKYRIRLVSGLNVQIRDLALEAVRQTLQNRLSKRLLKNYYFSCRAHPHQILRDNKTFSGGTKGERVQTGMKHSFGSAAGRAAVVKVGKDIFVIEYNSQKETEVIRAFCKLAIPKLPSKTKIVFEEIAPN